MLQNMLTFIGIIFFVITSLAPLHFFSIHPIRQSTTGALSLFIIKVPN